MKSCRRLTAVFQILARHYLTGESKEQHPDEILAVLKEARSYACNSSCAAPVAYLLSLGPMLYLGSKYHVPDIVWDSYLPVWLLCHHAPFWMRDAYVESYLQLWTDYLPFDYLFARGLMP